MRKLSKEISPVTLTKTGIMMGLGETVEECEAVFVDAKRAGVDILTLGQYLKPSKDSAEVSKYYTPDEFDQLKEIALNVGIKYVFSGPFVRSSYLAEHVFQDVVDHA